MPVALVTLSHIAADNTTKQYFPETHIIRAGSQSDLGWYDTAPRSGVTVLFVMTVE